MFISGKPLYEVSDESRDGVGKGPTPADVLEAERQAILDEGDFQEYKV